MRDGKKARRGRLARTRNTSLHQKWVELLGMVSFSRGGRLILFCSSGTAGPVKLTSPSMSLFASCLRRRNAS